MISFNDKVQFIDFLRKIYQKNYICSLHYFPENFTKLHIFGNVFNYYTVYRLFFIKRILRVIYFVNKKIPELASQILFDSLLNMYLSMLLQIFIGGGVDIGEN